MIETADDVTDVVQITCDRRKFLLPAVETHPLQYVTRDVGHQADMAESMLGITDCPEIAICVSNEGLHLRIGLDRVQADGRLATTRLTIARSSKGIRLIAV